MVLWSLGLAVLCVFLFRFLFTTYRYLLGKPLNLLERYGRGSWVLVTGGSQGIGRAFGETFAAMGFNVVLVARSQAKLETAAAEIRYRYPSVAVEVVSMDLYKCKDSDFPERLDRLIGTKDISVLVNNVGISYGGLFAEQPMEKLLNELVLCDEATLIITRLMAPKLVARRSRSGIIFNSGLTAAFPAPKLALHSGTKAFEHFLADALEYELRAKVDVLSLLPSSVSSARLSNLQPNWYTSSPQAVATGAVRDLGQYFTSFGSWKHALQALGLSYLPREVRLWLLDSNVKYMIQHHGL